MAVEWGFLNGQAAIATVRPLCRDIAPIVVRTSGTQVARLFEADPGIPAFAIVQGDRPVGLIDRLGFVTRFASLYGRELYGHRPILELMDAAPLIVGIDTTVEEASHRVFTDKPAALNTGFILVEDGRYAGIVSGIDLLQAIAQSLAVANERLREAQSELVQAEKMAALGGLVAGIAHEINTPIGSALTAATAFGERAKAFEELTSGGSIRRSDIDRFIASALRTSEYMEVNIRRASELISGFKQVAVDQTSDQRRRFIFRQCLEDVLLSLRPRLRKEEVAVALVCPGEVELDSYPGALAQIVTNLVLNAITHAFGEGVSKEILLEVEPNDEKSVTFIVTDNGRGIDPANLPRVFDPFFTTKRGRGGTGLGLNITYNLATQRLGGTIRVENAEAGGARFVLTVPLLAPIGERDDEPG